MAGDVYNDYNNYLEKLEMTDDVPNVDLLQKKLVDLKDEEERLRQKRPERKRPY